MNNLLTALLSLALTFSIQAQEAKSVLLLGGKAHLPNGKTIDNSAIGIENGYINLLKNQMIYRIDVSEYDTVIHLNGQDVYPGFIAPNTTLGLREFDAVRATLDYADVGNWNPNLRAQIAFNGESTIIPTAVANGVLMAQVTPRSGVISGTSAIMLLNGENWKNATVVAEDGVHMNFPQYTTPVKFDSALLTIEQFLDEAKAYYTQENPEMNLRFEAMKGVFSGQKQLFVHCNLANEIIEAVELKRAYEIPHVVIVGGYDAPLVAEVLKDHEIPVIYKRVHSLPLRPEDPVDLPYKIPGMLAAKGVLFCIDESGDLEAINERNLPFQVGTAMAYGLPQEAALDVISLNAAKILGIDKNYGSIAPGKKANLFISTGDAFDIMTNNVIMAIINGEIIPIHNRQYELYQEFK